jgi:hypothetical protein
VAKIFTTRETGTAETDAKVAAKVAAEVAKDA